MRPDKIVRQYLRSRFLITMKTGQTWDGLLYDADPSTLVLRDVSAVQGDGSKVPADGEVFLPRTDVAYMQRLS